MTKKNKLLSIVCLAVLSLVCAFGMMFSGSASTAKAELSVPTVDSSAILSRDVSIASVEEAKDAHTCSGGSKNLNIVYTNGAKAVDYVVLEWTNVSIGANGGNTFFYGAGKAHAHANNVYSISAEAYNKLRTADANIKIYLATTTGAVTAVVNDETEFALTALTPVEDPANTASPFAWCFHAMGAAGMEIKDVKAYSITGTTVADVKVNFGDNFIREDINFPTAPVSSSVTGKDYVKNGGGSYISTANPTNDEWIIFEITDGGTTAMAASNNFHFGFNAAAGSADATANSVADWSPIIIKDGATGRYWLNTKTGDIFKSTNALTETPVLEPLTVGGIPVYTNKNVGLENVYGKIYFNANVTKIDFTNVKAYDSQGNDLGINTNLPIILPTPDVAEVETANLKISNPQGYMANANAPATGASWVIFDYNPVNNGLRGGNPENSFHMAVKNDGSFGSGVMPQYTGNYVTTAEHVRVLVNIKTGDAYYERDGVNTYFKTLALPAFAEGQYPTVTMMFNIFESAGSAGADGIACLRLNNIKVYDDLGNDLGLKTTGNWMPDLPYVDSSEMTANSVIFTTNCGGDGYLAYDNAIVNAGAVGEGAKYLIFEYTNAETNNIGGGNGAFIGLGNNPDRIQHNKNGAHVLFEASSTIKLYVNVETGEVSYYKNGEYSAFTTLTVPTLADGQYAVFNFAPHAPAVKPVIVNDVKCYDDLGNEIGIKVGGKAAILGTEPTIEDTATATNYEAVSGSVAFSNTTATTSEWIVFEWTNGAENVATGSHNAFYVGIVTDSATALTSNKTAAEHIGRVFGATGKKVKLYFNTREGYIGYAVEGLTADGDIHIVATGLTTTDGTTPVYAKINTVSSVVGLFNDFKCYDGEGNDLGETTTFAQEVHVTFESTSIGTQASRWLMYWSIKDSATQEDLHFSYSISSLNINGTETALAADIAAYDVGGVHCWLFNYNSLFMNGETAVTQVAPLTITLEAGHVFKVGNISYILDNTFYIYISGTNAVVSTTEREEISLLTEDADTNFIYGSASGGRYQGDLYALIGGEKQVLPIYNIALKKFGTEDLVVCFEYAVVAGDPISYAEISRFGATESYTELVNQWYVLPAGSIIGNVYVTDVDYIIQINKDTFNIFAKDKVFNVTYDVGGVEGVETPDATTFSYASDFEILMPEITVPEGYEFDGWKINGVVVESIVPGMYGKDVTVVAGLRNTAAPEEPEPEEPEEPVVSDLPSPDVSAILGENFKIASGSANFANASAPAADAKWIIFDYNPVNNGLRCGNTSNSFHMAVKNDGSFGSGAMPQYTGNYVTTAEHVRVLVNIETGEAYYERIGEAPVLFNTFVLPTLEEEGQYFTVTMLINGFEAHGTVPESGVAHLAFNNFKVYDDLGNDLGLKNSGNWLIDIPAPDVTEIEGLTLEADGGSCTYLANETATTSEWIIFEWTNLAETALANGANSGYCYLGTNAGLQHKTPLSAALWNIYNKGEGEVSGNIKLAFNTKEGKVYKSVNDNTYTLAGQLVEGMHDGTVASYACFCLHQPNTAVIEGLKIYDAEGNNLGVKHGFKQTVHVTFENISASVQPDHKVNAGTAEEPIMVQDSRWIIYWNVKVTGTEELAFPFFTFGEGKYALNVNGEDVYSADSSSCYTFSGSHAWILYTKTVEPGLKDMRKLGHKVIKFEAGQTFKDGAIEYVLDNTFYIIMNSTYVEVTDNATMKDVKFKEATGNSAVDLGKRYQGDFLFTDVEGNDIEEFGLFNFKANLNGKNGEEVLVVSEYQNGVNLFFYSSLTQGANTYFEVAPRYYYIPAGTVLGARYVTTEALILSIAGKNISMFVADDTLAFNVTYAGLTGEETTDNPTAFNYVDAGSGVLTAPTGFDAEEKRFVGWFDEEGNQVFTLAGLTADVTLTAKFAANLPTGVEAPEDAATKDIVLTAGCGGSGLIILDNNFQNATAVSEGAQWIYAEWTNAETNVSTAAANAGFIGISTGTGTSHATNGVPQLFAPNTTVILLANVISGEIYASINGEEFALLKTVTVPAELAEGQFFALSICAHAATATAPVKVNGVKFYDETGADLGVKASNNAAILGTEPTIDGSAVEGTDYEFENKTIVFKTSVGTTSEWIVFEWTNGPENAYDGNRNNSFYANISTDNTETGTSTGAHTDRVLTTADAKVKLYFNTVEGYLGYTITGITGEGELHIIKTGLTTYDGENAVFAIVYFNETKTEGKFLGFKCYDADGNAIEVEHNLAVEEEPAPEIPEVPEDIEVPAPDVSDITGIDIESGGSECTYLVNKTATTSEWIIFEWTNLTETAVANGSNSGYCYIGSNAGLQHGKSFGVDLWNIYNKGNEGQGEFVKLAFNTRNGGVFKSINGGAYTLAGKLEEGMHDGTVASYACFCIHKKDNTAVIEDLKIYDGEGNDLGVTHSFKQTLHVNFESTSIGTQDSRWLMYFDVKDSTTGEKYYPVMLTLGNESAPLVINGEEKVLAGVINGYDIAGGGPDHTWIVNYSSFYLNGETSIYQVAPMTITFEEGYVFKSGSVEYVLDNTFYIVISGIDVEVTNTLERTEVKFKEITANSAVDVAKRYQASIAFTDAEGNDVEGVGLYNFYANLGGKNGTKTLVVSRLEKGINLFDYNYLTAGAETSDAVGAKLFYIPAGSAIGTLYKTAEDLVLIFDGKNINMLKPNANGYTITYAGLGEGESHTNPATYNYATDGFKKLTAPTFDSTAKKFLGWFDAEGNRVDSITGMTADLALTAKFLSADIYQAQGAIYSDKFVMTFTMKASLADLVIKAFVGSESFTCTNVTADYTGLEEGTYIYKFSIEVALADIDKVLNVEFKSEIGEVLASVEISVADYLDGIAAVEGASDELKTLVADVKAYAYALDTDATNDTVEGMSTVATIEDEKTAIAKKGTGVENFEITGPTAIEYADGKFKITVKAKVTEMQLAEVLAVAGDNALRQDVAVEAILDGEEVEYTFEFALFELGYIEFSVIVGEAAKTQTIMVNGANLIALMGEDITANKTVLDRASCLVLSAQAYLAA